MVPNETPINGTLAEQNATHEFWDTQPVPKLGESIVEYGPIDQPKRIEDIRSKPLNLLNDFVWSELDMTVQTEVDEVYELLSNNYVEDTDAMFRFNYSSDFLQWALLPPGFRRDWHIGVRVKTSKKLVAFVSAIPAKVQVYESIQPMVEINYLCVHKKLRSKRLAPVLIKEITRRVNKIDVWQAVYTAGVLLPRPVGRNRYYHRSLNPKKLVEVAFSQLPRRLTMKMQIRLMQLPKEPLLPGVREMRADDVPSANELLSNYLSKFKLYAHFSDEEFAHWFLPRNNVIYSYVVEDPNSRSITDMMSFYCLPSTVLGHPKHSTLRAAFSFYNVASSAPWHAVMQDALVLACKNGFDVFNMLNVMDNNSFFKELKFGIGDGNLHYYLYNWRCPEISSEDCALVLM